MAVKGIKGSNRKPQRTFMKEAVARFMAFKIQEIPSLGSESVYRVKFKESLGIAPIEVAGFSNATVSAVAELETTIEELITVIQESQNETIP